MSKLDELRRGAGGNAAESVGAGVALRSLAEGVSVPIGGTRYKDLTKTKNAFEVPVDKIMPDPSQPRKVFTPEDLQDLSDSIRAGASCNRSVCVGMRSERSTSSWSASGGGVLQSWQVRRR